MAAKLRLMSEKVAEEDEGRFAAASRGVSELLGERSWDGPLKIAAAQEEDLAVRHAAARLGQDPQIYNAVLAIKAAEAAEAAEWADLLTQS